MVHLSAQPSICLHVSIRLSLDRFVSNLTLETLWKICQENVNLTKIGWKFGTYHEDLRVFHIVNYDAGSQQCKFIFAFQWKQWLGKRAIMLYVHCLSYLYLHDISSFIFFCYKIKITKICIYFCKLEERKKVFMPLSILCASVE